MKSELEKIVKGILCGVKGWIREHRSGHMKLMVLSVDLMILMMIAVLVSHQQKWIKSQHMKSGRRVLK